MPLVAKNAKLTNTLLPVDFIMVGDHRYSKSKVFEPTGHFQEKFHKEELAKFYTNYFTIREHIRIYDHFKNRYPTLKDWFKDDLANRVGRLSGESYKTAQLRLAYRSRWYIYHLCLFGLSLDYPYLFSIRATDGFTNLKKRYHLDFGLPDIQRIIKELKTMNMAHLQKSDGFITD